MNFGKLARAILPGAAAMTAYFALFGMVPETCACSPGWWRLAAVISVPPRALFDDPSPLLEATFNKALHERPTRRDDLPMAWEASCREEATHQFCCRVEAEHSLLLARGFELHFAEDAQGYLRDVRFERYVHWRLG